MPCLNRHQDITATACSRARPTLVGFTSNQPPVVDGYGLHPDSTQPALPGATAGNVVDNSPEANYMLHVVNSVTPYFLTSIVGISAGSANLIGAHPRSIASIADLLPLMTEVDFKILAAFALVHDQD